MIKALWVPTFEPVPTGWCAVAVERTTLLLLPELMRAGGLEAVEAEFVGLFASATSHLQVSRATSSFVVQGSLY